MKLSVAIPGIDAAVGGDPAAIRNFAQAAEEIGYQDLSAPDHVLGVNTASRADWGDRNTSADLFHDPFVLFGFLAGCTRSISFSTQVTDPGATSGSTRRQAGRLARRAMWRTFPPRHRGWLEPRRVHRPQRKFPQSRPPF